MNLSLHKLRTLSQACRRTVSIAAALAVLAGGIAMAQGLQEYLLHQDGVLALMSGEPNGDPPDKDKDNQVDELLGKDTVTTLDAIANGADGGGDGGGPGAPGSPGFGPGGGVNPANVSGDVDDGVSPSVP